MLEIFSELNLIGQLERKYIDQLARIRNFKKEFAEFLTKEDLKELEVLKTAIQKEASKKVDWNVEVDKLASELEGIYNSIKEEIK